MKKRSKLSMLGAGFAMAVAALMGGAQASQPLAQATQQTAKGGQSELKSTEQKKQSRKQKEEIGIGLDGGLDFGPMYAHSFPSPIWFGKSCRGKHTNKQRCKHNAKVKRRGK